MLREKILGAWRLVSYVEKDDRGGPVTFPLGRDAVGLIMYTSYGYMSAQLMRSGRHGYDEPDIDGGTVQQAAAAAEGYLAYSGPYDVDESASVVHHRVAVSLLPNWLDTVQVRRGSLKDNQLTLVAEIPVRGAVIRSTLVWARAPEQAPSAR